LGPVKYLNLPPGIRRGFVAGMTPYEVLFEDEEGVMMA
jgi:hypothetical protein